MKRHFLGDSESGSARGSSEEWTPAYNVTGEWTCELEYVIDDIIEGGVEFRELTTNMDIYYESGATFVWGYLGDSDRAPSDKQPVSAMKFRISESYVCGFAPWSDTENPFARCWDTADAALGALWRNFFALFCGR